MEPWVWGIIVPVGIALVGALYGLLRRGPERTESRLDEHIKEDVKVHERVSVVESKVERMESQLDGQGGVMDRLHRHGNDITRALGKLFLNDKK